MVSLYHKERESQALKRGNFQEKSSPWVHSTEPQDIGGEYLREQATACEVEKELGSFERVVVRHMLIIL